MNLDFDARYRVSGMTGVAWRLTRMESERYWDPFYDDYDERETGMVVAIMVGDDREHIIDPDDLEKIDDDDYCHECGQIGCTHDGR